MTCAVKPPVRLLIRALDAGSTYLSFRWTDRPDHPWIHRLDVAEVARVAWLLDNALIGNRTDDDDGEVRRALNGPLSRLDSEREFSTELATLVTGHRFADEINERAATDSVVIEYTPSPTTARVPVDLLPVDGDIRVMEKAELVYTPPAALNAGRADRSVRNWEDVAERPVLYVVDPDAPDAAGLRQVLPPVWLGKRTNATLFADRIAATAHTENSGVREWISRWMLHDDLCSAPSRLFYFGHVSGTLNQPGSASLHLSDDEYTWGLAAIHGGSHRPLSALDLVYGTVTYPGTADGTVERALRHLPGRAIWPMPLRVAIIACEGGSDYRSAEIFGLVTACMNSGAELVSTTRWTLPADRAFAEFTDDDDAAEVPGPTTELALAVDSAHRSDDPPADLTRWRRKQLQRWRESGADSVRNTPLVWAGLTEHVCPARPVSARGGTALGEGHDG